ncbi:MAG: alpha/beta fold hydrolase [Roseovarius sp.]
MPSAQRGGFETYWTSYGHGPRAALALHCSLAHSGSWAGLAKRIATEMTLTAFDLPGHGRSGAWHGRGDIQALSVAMAADFLDAQAPADLLGHSFGATVALRLAVERPELVRSLILIEPVFFAAGFADTPGARATFDSMMTGYAGAMAAGDLMGAAQAFATIWGGGMPWEAIPPAQREAMAERMPLIKAAEPTLYEDEAGLLVPSVLEGVGVPVLLVEGSESPAIVAAIHEALAARLPRAERTMIGGAGHMAPLTHPRQVGSEVLRFLEWA